MLIILSEDVFPLKLTGQVDKLETLFQNDGNVIKIRFSAWIFFLHFWSIVLRLKNPTRINKLRAAEGYLGLNWEKFGTIFPAFGSDEKFLALLSLLKSLHLWKWWSFRLCISKSCIQNHFSVSCIWKHKCWRLSVHSYYHTVKTLLIMNKQGHRRTSWYHDCFAFFQIFLLSWFY